MENRALFKLFVDCGRMGNLEGIFISTKTKVDSIIGKYIYFGEVLGKHSEIYGDIERDWIEFITDDENAIEIFDKHSLSSGFNPFDYLGDVED